MAYTNTYQRINWQNLPSEATALNDVNLNKMDAEIYAHGEQFETVDTALGHKVDKESGKGLSAIKTLSISTSANTGTDIASISYKDQNNLTVGYTIKNGVVVDSALSGSSTNPVQNKVVKSALDGKSTVSIADTLPTGDTIANLTIDGTTTAIKAPLVEVDDEIDITSENPVQNKVIAEALREIMPEVTVTGNPISISDGSNVIPAKLAEVTFLPKQSGSGEPSPDNVRPISGWTELNLTRTGKNIAKNNATETTNAGVKFTPSIDGSFVISQTSTATYPQVNLDSARSFLPLNTNVTLSVTTEGTIPSGAEIYAICYERDTISGGQVASHSSKNGAITFQATHPYQYIVLVAQGNGITYNNVKAKVQLELGNQSTAYEPYNGHTYTESLGSTYYGGKVDFVSGEVVIDRAVVDLGDLSWGIGNSGQPTQYFYSSSLTDYKYINDSTVNYIFEQYRAIPVSQRYIDGTGFINSGKSVAIKDDNYSTKEAFKASVTGYKVCYELATPIELTLTPQEIELLKGANVLWSDSNGNIKLTYSADIAQYIANQLNS